MKGDVDIDPGPFCSETDIVQAAALSSGVVEESDVPENLTETHTEYIVEITDESDQTISTDQAAGSDTTVQVSGPDSVASEVQIGDGGTCIASEVQVSDGGTWVPMAGTNYYFEVNKDLIDQMEPNCIYYVNDPNILTGQTGEIQFEPGETDDIINTALQSVTEVTENVEDICKATENTESNNPFLNLSASIEDTMDSDGNEINIKKGYSLDFFAHGSQNENETAGNREEKSLDSHPSSISTNDDGRDEQEINGNGESCTATKTGTPMNKVDRDRYILHDQTPVSGIHLEII